MWGYWGKTYFKSKYKIPYNQIKLPFIMFFLPFIFFNQIILKDLIYTELSIFIGLTLLKPVFFL
jgi:hypothetical protein